VRIPIVFLGKKLTTKQVQRLIDKKATTNIKGFVKDDLKVEGVLRLSETFQVEFEPKKLNTPKNEPAMPSCPKCKEGTIIKGQTAYGCSHWKQGCDFRFSFEAIKAKANGKPLTKELVLEIIGG
jgi:DNA topoisomerase-3